jgi:hypothetical protein
MLFEMSIVWGSLGCNVERMLNHTDTIAQFLLLQHHLHTPYRSASVERAPSADVEVHVVAAVRLE